MSDLKNKTQEELDTYLIKYKDRARHAARFMLFRMFTEVLDEYLGDDEFYTANRERFIYLSNLLDTKLDKKVRNKYFDDFNRAERNIKYIEEIISEKCNK